jgi:hypothetical protein
MNPPEPANDERPPLWPGMSRRAEERLQWAGVIVGLTAGIGCILIFAAPSTLKTIGIGVAVIFAWAIITAIYRLIVYGRA